MEKPAAEWERSWKIKSAGFRCFILGGVFIAIGAVLPLGIDNNYPLFIGIILMVIGGPAWLYGSLLGERYKAEYWKKYRGN